MTAHFFILVPKQLRRWRRELLNLFYLDCVGLLIQSAEDLDALAFVSLRLSLVIQLVTQVADSQRIAGALFDDCSSKRARLPGGFGLP